MVINERWCTNVTTISKNCTKNLEHISLKCRPFYLPREFSSVIITGVYIHPHADIKDALHDLNNIISKYENDDPDTASIVLGDFNQANLSSVLPNYHQMVTCPTRGLNTLDHCYTKIKLAYKSFERAGIGNSDHSVVSLVPNYIQKVKQSEPVTIKTLRWTETAVNKLKACFDITDWRVFRDTWTTLDEYTDTVSEYIRFCVDLCIPTKTVTKYANNKRWYDKIIRKKIVLKDRAYRQRNKDPESYLNAKYQLRQAIKGHKNKYKTKLEDVFRSGDSKSLWSHMSDITQYKGPNRSIDNNDQDLPDQLNSFYARFDRDTKQSLSAVQSTSLRPHHWSSHKTRFATASTPSMYTSQLVQMELSLNF